MDVPLELRLAIEAGNAVLFVGAGMGYNMTDTEGKAIPDAKELAQRMALHFDVPCDDNFDLAQVSQYVEIKKKNRVELLDFIKLNLADANPDEYMAWIPNVRWKAIFTTNYDNSIEKAYDRCTNPVQDYLTITHVSGFREYSENSQVPIIHLHGSLFDSCRDIILTRQDFTKYEGKRKSLFELLKLRMVTSTILYTGYSHNDPNFEIVISEIEKELYPDKPAHAFRIDPHAKELEAFILEARNITTLKVSFNDFVAASRLQIENRFVSSDKYESYLTSIPEDFQSLFSENSPSTVRLFSSWQYINQIKTSGFSSIYNYVRGDKPSWEIILEGKYFHRSLEDEIYEAFLDYVTEPYRKLHVSIISAPAGYGITTLLMSLAKRIVEERVGRVLFHINAKELKEGDIFFATTNKFDEPLFFFIDNAADYTKTLQSIIKQARERKLKIIIVLGDRLNELLQTKTHVPGDRFEIQPLSDSEIESLLDFLEINGELNKLQHLTREHQVAAIKRNYKRELLVAVREATEGRDFDTIIQDEYYGIRDEFSRNVYSVVACFHQHNALIRCNLLARMVGTSLVDMYEKIKESLEGIIFYETLDFSDMEFTARTRHRLISSIVWNRCILPAEKDRILHDSLSCLNLAFSIDKEAFDRFVRSDQIVDSLSSLESRIRFFDKACKMDPDNPYVRQHYARMLTRSNQETTALSIINDAIKMDSSIRALHHTQGYILQNMALSADNIEMGRRWLGQSEEAYSYVIRNQVKDSYGYQGLISLYLGWAKKCEIESERILYIAKAEKMVNIALEKCVDKEAIWIEAANIDGYLGDLPTRISSLRQAVNAAPTSTLSRFLLAKALIADYQHLEGIEIIKGVVLEHPDEYRSSIEYAKALLITGHSLNEAIAVLQQSTLYGYSDARYLAFLGGLLFLNKQFQECDKVFDEAKRRDISYLHQTFFHPSDCGLNDQYEAIIQYVSGGYSYVSISGFPDIRCNSSKIHDTIMSRGMSVSVQIYFTPYQPRARIVE